MPTTVSSDCERTMEESRSCRRCVEVATWPLHMSKHANRGQKDGRRCATVAKSSATHSPFSVSQSISTRRLHESAMPSVNQRIIERNRKTTCQSIQQDNNVLPYLSATTVESRHQLLSSSLSLFHCPSEASLSVSSSSTITARCVRNVSR